MEDLQNLLEKINREGIEKADREAHRIIGEATEKAAAIVKTANDDAERARAAAAAEATAAAARATETLRQAARDVQLELKNAVTRLLEQILVRDVDLALSDGAAVASLVAKSIGELAGPGEISCGPALAKTLVSQLAGQKAFTVVTDETLSTGFTVKVENGRVEHAFTGDVIAAELAKRLRPDLAALLK